MLPLSAVSQPSLEAFGEIEEHDRHQDHEQDRSVRAGQVVALGELVDELAEAAEVDQELDADDIDHREDEAEPQTHENGWQGGGQQDHAELLRTT